MGAVFYGIFEVMIVMAIVILIFDAVGGLDD